MRARRIVSITCWNSSDNEVATAMHFEVDVNKNCLLKFVKDWWNYYGTGIQDFTTMKLEFKSERKPK